MLKLTTCIIKIHYVHENAAHNHYANISCFSNILLVLRYPSTFFGWIIQCCNVIWDFVVIPELLTSHQMLFFPSSAMYVQFVNMHIYPDAPCMEYLVTHIWHEFMVNVGTYSIHGAYGMYI